MPKSCKRPAIAALAAAAALLAACGGASDPSTGGTAAPDAGRPPAPTGPAPAEVSIALRNDVDSFDPHKSAGDSGPKQLFDAIYDTLVRAPADGSAAAIEPALAASWKTTPTSATFRLKPRLSCGDGSPLRASGVARSLQRIADPRTGAAYASRVFGPGGAKRIAGDDRSRTVTIELNQPYTYLLQGLTFAYVVCPSGLANAAQLESKPAETGPYVVSSLRRGTSYVLTRRDDPAVEQLEQMPERLELRVVTDDTTRANLVETGDLDVASILGPDAKRLVAEREPIVGAAFLADALLFNQAPGHPGTDPRLRKALMSAVDAASYARAATFDIGRPIATEYTPNMACHDDENGSLTPGFDLERAKRELRAAGYGPGGRPLTLRVLGWDAMNAGPEYLADALRAAGVDVKVTKGTLTQALPVLFESGAWDVMGYTFQTSNPIPSALTSQISGKLGETLNFGHVRNAEYDRLARQASATQDPQRRCELERRAEAALLTRADIKPLVWSAADWFTDGLTFAANYYFVDTRTIRAAG